MVVALDRLGDRLQAQRDQVLVFAGGLVVAVLAVLTEIGLGAVERRVDPLRRGSRRLRAASR